ncbi:hypothetical protein D0Z07_2113 [Hyphodiscus hymeniophilus]|uniref:RRM domain-containing protein n=1 Tax=Hyphodiscus hymeniophilus TaxID=353542 RepID=A0A9P6VMX2_9HELO|nr:hypothetical protein D0Z07_2113 [Hyphodiscus hymeniophilus]
MGLTEDLWFSCHNIEVSKVIPGIPDPYFDDCAKGHALYVTGVSALNSPGEVTFLFEGCARVKYTITLLDLNSGETFRWVVMKSFEDAQKALKERQSYTFGSRTINLCYAVPPGSVVALLGRSIMNIFRQQIAELENEDIIFKHARQECINKQPGTCCGWFDGLMPARAARVGIGGHTAESSFVGYVEGDATPEVRKTKLFNPAAWSPSFQKYIDERWAADRAAALAKAKPSPNGKSPLVVDATIVEEEAAPAKSTVIATPIMAPPTAPVAPAIPVHLVAPTAPVPVIPIPPVVPVAPTRVAAPSSWANIAAPATNRSNHLVFNLHPENKSSSTAPRVSAPVNPNVIAHQQGESLEEQMRVVIILNLPQNITLQDVSDAISEGPVLMIHFASDADNGHRYVGIIFQYAEDAKAFRMALIQEKIDKQPGRFRFIVDVGDESMTYPYDEMLENMDPPMIATRRLTIVKKAFFFVLTKKDLRKICISIVGSEKIQLIWFYNGGNATVIFADVKVRLFVFTVRSVPNSLL